MGTFATTTALQPLMIGTVFDTATVSLAGTCIGLAEDEIRKQLSSRYDMTLTNFQDYIATPPVIRSLCIQLAVGYMYENMSRGSKEGFARADRYIKRVMDNLKEIADGTLQLLDSNGAVMTGDNTRWQVKCNTTDYTPTFNEDSPKNWKVDETKLGDIADERGDPGEASEID